MLVVVMSVKYAYISEVCVGKAERERERENNISLALVVEKDKRWRRARKEN